MRKLNATLIIAIAVVIAAWSQLALAGGKKGIDKSSAKLLNATTTGSHYKQVTITTRTKSKPVPIPYPNTGAVNTVR